MRIRLYKGQNAHDWIYAGRICVLCQRGRGSRPPWQLQSAREQHLIAISKSLHVHECVIKISWVNKRNQQSKPKTQLNSQIHSTKHRELSARVRARARFELRLDRKITNVTNFVNSTVRRKKNQTKNNNKTTTCGITKTLMQLTTFNWALGAWQQLKQSQANFAGVGPARESGRAVAFEVLLYLPICHVNKSFWRKKQLEYKIQQLQHSTIHKYNSQNSARIAVSSCRGKTGQEHLAKLAAQGKTENRTGRLRKVLWCRKSHTFSFV